MKSSLLSLISLLLFTVASTLLLAADRTSASVTGPSSGVDAELAETSDGSLMTTSPAPSSSSKTYLRANDQRAFNRHASGTIEGALFFGSLWTLGAVNQGARVRLPRSHH